MLLHCSAARTAYLDSICFSSWLSTMYNNLTNPDSGALWEIMFVLRILYVEDNKNVVHLELFRKVEWSEKQFYLKKII